MRKGGSRGRTVLFVGIGIVLIAVAAAAGLELLPGLSQTPYTASNSAGSLASGSGSTVPTSAASSPSASTASTLTSAVVTSASSMATTSGGYWPTYHGNNSRDGLDASLASFSSLSTAWKANVDGAIYAEPLSFDGLVFVATENDTVYAFNATSGGLAWSAHLGTPVGSAVAPYACNGNKNGPDIRPTIGVTGTPVIDPASGTLYVAALVNGTGYELFALSIGSGKQVWHSAITAAGFNYMPEEQRSALALANGFVYVSFGGYSWNCFYPGPGGWVIAMPASGGGAAHAFRVPATPDGDLWNPEGISVGAQGYLYAVTGDSDNSTFDLGNSVIRLSPDLTWTNSSANFFAPSDWLSTDSSDLDLGSTGATLLPGGLVFAIGKDGIGYLLNESELGGVGGQLYSAYVCRYGGMGSTSYAAGVIYVPCADGLHALSVQGGSSPRLTALWNSSDFFAGPAITTPGAVWSLGVTTGTLYVLNPATGTTLAQASLGSVEHFTTPSIADGRVIVAANETVYALSPG